MIAAAFCLCLGATAAPPPIDFNMRSPDNTALMSEDGTVTLAWSPPTLTARIELQQAATPAFDDAFTRFQGRDDGSVVTGLREGRHYFRIRTLDTAGEASPWSTPLAVEVKFMERGRLFLLLGLGSLVVVLTIGAIIAGFIHHRDDLTGQVGGGA